jgi:Uma2 family endonuclease
MGATGVAFRNARCYISEMHSLPNHFMTVDEFLPWAEAQERGRYELHDGQVIMMSPERAAHWKTKGAIFVALREAIKSAGPNCHAVPDGATVRISPSTAFEPDALVYCGEEVPDNSLEVPNPVIVVEVLSPGTQMTDMRDKLRGYFTVSSVHHYLIVDPEKRMVIHHARGSGDVLQTRLLSSGALSLEPPGLSIEIETLFA